MFFYSCQHQKRREGGLAMKKTCDQFEAPHLSGVLSGWGDPPDTLRTYPGACVWFAVTPSPGPVCPPSEPKTSPFYPMILLKAASAYPFIYRKPPSSKHTPVTPLPNPRSPLMYLRFYLMLLTALVTSERLRHVLDGISASALASTGETAYEAAGRKRSRVRPIISKQS